jgi:hypothetical protein
VLMNGCATVPTADIRIDAEADPKVNFSAYKTYAWLGSAEIVYDPKGRWEPPRFDADAEIKFLIDRELRKRGMIENSVNPDMAVAFAAGIDTDALKVTRNPETKMVILEEAPQGGLLVILADVKTGYVVWVGRALADLQKDPTPEVMKKRLDYAVKKMIGNLPK